MNALGAAAHKKAQPKEGSPEEEMNESPAEAKAEGDEKPMQAKAPKSPKQKAAIAAKMKGKV